MRAARTIAVLLVTGVGCSRGAASDVKSPGASGHAAVSAVAIDRDTSGTGAPPPSDSLTAILADLAPRLVPLRVSIDSFRAVLRADSGTVRADSALLAFRASFAAEVREVNHEYALNEYFQRILYPAVMKRMGEHQSAAIVAAADTVDHLLNAYGIWTAEGEGNADLEMHETWLLALAGPFVSEAMRGFLRVEAVDQTIPAGYDADISIGWDAFSDRIAARDSLLAAFPEMLARQKVYHELARDLFCYVMGVDNEPPFDRQTGVLMPELRQSYERYVARHGSTAIGEMIRGYLAVLRATDYHGSPASSEYARKHVDFRELEKPD